MQWRGARAAWAGGLCALFVIAPRSSCFKVAVTPKTAAAPAFSNTTFVAAQTFHASQQMQVQFYHTIPPFNILVNATVHIRVRTAQVPARASLTSFFNQHRGDSLTTNTADNLIEY